ncbi:MAG: AMP-binding protein [Oceanococcus sp.]
MSLPCHPQGGFISQGHVYSNGQILTAARDWRAVDAGGEAWINDQADRARFAVGLLLANDAEQPCLLPASSAVDHLNQIHALYPKATDLVSPELSEDLPVAEDFQPWHVGDSAVVCFTSGSTGQPKPIHKSWSALQGSVRGMARAAAWRAGKTHIVATVPPQHMFGLEMSVLSALICGCRVDAGKPFFPQDIVDAVARLPHPRVLVSTPLHLRALLNSGLDWPRVDQIVSATAPLDQVLALALEQACGGQVLEVYGSTETGAIASRATARSDIWTLFDSARFIAAFGAEIAAEHLPLGCNLQDDIDRLDERRFRLRGRPQNMLKVAGKRYSLDALNHQLLALPGVDDAFALLLPERDRPAALVVAPGLELSQIRQALAQRIDPVFMPRPLLKVTAIPRNATGKVRQQDVLALLQG